MLYWFMQPARSRGAEAGHDREHDDRRCRSCSGSSLASRWRWVTSESAAVIATVSAAGDALDGWIARETGTSSNAGEVFDAAVDRYVELAFLGGLAFYLPRATRSFSRSRILALGGSFMVSYATAKAEAMQVTAPRGAMRRTERAVYLTAAIAVTPIFQAAFTQRMLGPSTPIAFALALVGVVGNASATRRLSIVAAALRLARRPARGNARGREGRVVQRRAASARALKPNRALTREGPWRPSSGIKQEPSSRRSSIFRR